MISSDAQEKKTIEALGRRMAYVEMGEGDPVVFQHDSGPIPRISTLAGAQVSISELIEHLPARGARRVVRARGQAAASRAGLRGPICRRSRAGLRAGRRREAGAWGAGETAGEVRPSAALGEDADGGVLQTVEVEAGRLAARAQLRDVGVHPLLGTLQEGAMGGQAENGQGPIQPSAEGDWPMVSAASALETARAPGGAEPQAERSLRVLRHHRQRSGAEPIPIPNGPAVAKVARPAKPAGAHDMGPVRAAAQHLSPPYSASRAQCVPLSSEAIVRGAGCPSWACPDLWEPRVGNYPRSPGGPYGFPPARESIDFAAGLATRARQPITDARGCRSVFLAHKKE